MRPDERDIESLNAYIDGELDPADASRIAQLIASDEAFARRAAKLAQIKSAIAGMAPEVVVVSVPGRRSLPARFLPLALAACLGAAVVSAAWLGLSPALQISSPDPALSQAAAQHDLWLEEGMDHTGVTPAHAPPGLFGSEMIAAGLTLAFVRDDVLVDGERAVQAGYVGRQGCRLSLFRIAANTTPQEFELSSEDGLLHASWSGDATRYVLVARGMDDARFAVIAGVLKSVSESVGRPNSEMIASLEAMRQPCVG